MSSMRDAMSVKQIEYKNAELVLCEFMAVQIYDEDKPFDLYINSRQKWKKWPYRKCQLKKSTVDWNQIYNNALNI